MICLTGLALLRDTFFVSIFDQIFLIYSFQLPTISTSELEPPNSAFHLINHNPTSEFQLPPSAFKIQLFADCLILPSPPALKSF